MAAQQAPSPGSGEYVMTAEDFRRIAAMLYADSGIVMGEGKESLVYSRLTKRLRALGLESFRSYCALVAGAEGVDERQRMLSALTTNLTRFFREPHHFEHLKAKVLPPLAAAARRGGRVRLWSAACSNGAEAYSIAMTLLSVMPDALEHDVRVLATDIDVKMIEACRRGLYEPEQVRDAPAALRDRWMRRVQADGAEAWEASEDLRELIAFRELNLIGAWPMRGRFDAVFCRNVAIYFDEPTQTELWRRLSEQLAPGGRLYIGHSERVGGEALGRLVSEGVTTYALAGGAR